MDDELGDECTICLSSSLILNRTLDCGHSFHNDCINQWLKNDYTCPICRSVAVTSFKVKIIYPSTFFNLTYRIELKEDRIEIKRGRWTKYIIMYDNVKGIICQRNMYSVDIIGGFDVVIKRITTLNKSDNYFLFRAMKWFMDNQLLRLN